MEKYFNYKHTKKELIDFINTNEGLANVETDLQGEYIDINVEIYPSGKFINYCRVNIKQDKQATGQALKVAAVLNDYLAEYEQIKA